MKKIIELIKTHKKNLIGVVILIIVYVSFFFIKSNQKEIVPDEPNTLISDTTIQEESSVFYVDVKGSVKKPGVYEVKTNDRVIDAITMAGGLTKSANTSNINLSEKLTSEMVVYVYSNTEVKNGSNKITCDTVCSNNTIEINNCANQTIQGNKVNINTASIEQLETITGIGESKAKSIIEYRNTKPFETIEDIQNVSGIGASLYESIKDEITV